MPPTRTRHDGSVVTGISEQASLKGSRPQSSKGRSRRTNLSGRQDDDAVSAISDEEYAPDPDDEPRFKYSTAELADGSARNTTCCIITMVVLCVIVAIVLSIVMVRVFQDKDEDNKEPAPTFAPTTLDQAGQPGINMFQSPQSTIEDDLCSVSNARSSECEAACAGFDCCDPTLPMNESCFFYNQEGCLNYQRCHIVQSGVDVPPFNLASICSPDQIASDPTECEEACSGVQCCWNSEVTCYNNFYTCLDYAECQNLRSEVTVPVATSSVYNLCTGAGSVTQSDACETACEPAECCWAENPAENCFQSEMFACMTYVSCGKLTIPAAGEVVSLPPASLSSDCSVASINAGNTAACESSCSNGSCCVEGAADYCFLEDPLSCIAYEPCEAFSICVVTGNC